MGMSKWGIVNQLNTGTTVVAGILSRVDAGLSVTDWSVVPVDIAERCF
jgi:hypothetical protein